MSLIFKLVALAFLGVALIDGAFDSRGLDPWDSNANLPGGFFTLLRISVTIAGFYTAWELYRMLGRPTSLAFVYGAIGVLFQPVIPVHFEYETWLWIDLFIFAFIAIELIICIQISRAMLRKINE